MLCIGFLCVLLSCTFRRHIYLNNGLTIFRKSFHWIKMSRTTIALSKYCVLFFFWVRFNLCKYSEMFALTDFRLSSMNNTHCREHIRTKPGWLIVVQSAKRMILGSCWRSEMYPVFVGLNFWSELNYFLQFKGRKRKCNSTACLNHVENSIELGTNQQSIVSSDDENS